MFRSTRSTIICTALVVFTMIGGAALAQRREAAQPKDDPRTGMPSLAEAGVVLDYANAQPEFRDALKPKNTEQIRGLLLSYGLSDQVKVYDHPMNNTVPGGPYTNCYSSAIHVYYPNPPYSWPNNPRTIVIIICENVAGGSSDFGWN